MTVRRALTAITLVAIVHGLFFIWYQRPDWRTPGVWTDQDGYRQLGQVLAATGKFTRFPDAVPFVPDVLRMPAYPVFVAIIYKVAGVHQLPVAVAQTALFALICLLVFAIARRLASERVALGAALVTALFPPIPYFGALVMTEVWTTFLFTASIWMALRALESRRTTRFAAAGVLIALTALSRPVFVLFPIALAAVGLVIFPIVRVKQRPSLAQWAALVGAFTIAMVPWSMYNYVTMGRFTPTPPAGGVGRGLWEGQWQATWSGRLQDELTKIAEKTDDRALLDERVSAVAAREHTAAAPMLEYVHQWQDIRRIWTEPTDPGEHSTARVAADREYQRIALENLRKDSIGHLTRRLSRGVFILWAGEIPVRYSEINQLPRRLIYAVWAVQALVCLAALAGFVALYRAGRKAEALLFGSCLLYITAVHFPLLTEARQSLPAQPIVLVLATLGVASLAGHSLALEPQMHERQHL
jgi:4-amino-4-deoxy-L-arabinose transferase-like glycosyltransferase